MKKKLLKILPLTIIAIIIFGIYTIFKNDKISYIALGDSLAEGVNPYGEVGYSYTDYVKDYLKENNKLSYYSKEYTENGDKTTHLITKIQTNNKLKKDLRESDLVTVSIGANDFLDKVKIKGISIDNIPNLKTKIIDILPNLDNCIKEIKKYAKNDIIIVGYYNPIPFLFNTSGNDLDELFAYIDDEYQKIADKYNCEYVSLYQLFKSNTNFLPNPADIHPNLEGYESISEEIIEIIKKNA